VPKIIVKGPTYGSHQPMRLTVNGQTVEFPVNRETTVSDAHLSALLDTDHQITIIEGSTAADEAAIEAPAPADSGGGGDAGGGGDTGDPAAVTAPEAPPPVVEVVLPEGFLDRSVTKIIGDLGSLTGAQLAKAKADEDAGKTRKSLIAAIDGALAALPQD
jgi:hypothetical protein